MQPAGRADHVGASAPAAACRSIAAVTATISAFIKPFAGLQNKRPSVIADLWQRRRGTERSTSFDSVQLWVVEVAGRSVSVKCGPTSGIERGADRETMRKIGIRDEVPPEGDGVG